jgi:hypothetical protein
MSSASPDRLDTLRRWARLLDTAFEVPGLGIRFGWDPIIGLIPGLGDLVTPVFSAALILHAVTLRVPKIVLIRMLINVLLDVLAGMVPLAGDLVDVAWKANARNLGLLELHAAGRGRATTGDWVFVAGILAVLAAAAAVPLLLLGWLLSRLV